MVKVDMEEQVWFASFQLKMVKVDMEEVLFASLQLAMVKVEIEKV